MKTKTDKHWTPKRTGAIYCAPACGGRCTWAAFQAAHASARALVKELGKGWLPRVHENFGWHFSAVNEGNCCTVYRDGKDYSAYIGPNQPGGRWVGRGPTAKDAVRDGVRQVAMETEGMNALLAFMRGSL